MDPARARTHPIVLLVAGLLASTLPAGAGCQRLKVVDDTASGAPFTTGASSGTASGGSTGEPDPNPVFECDPIRQDCDAGQKCTAVAEFGVRNRYVCVTDGGDLDRDAPCSVADATGVDGCLPGLACVAADGVTGSCQPLCLMDADCLDGRCMTAPADNLAHCGDACDPFGALCAAPLECRAFQDEFICQLPREDDTGTTLFPCLPGDGHGCAAAFTCVPGTLLPGCNEPGCCTPLCDLTSADPHGGCQTVLGSASVSCVQFTETSGLTHVGACMIPF